MAKFATGKHALGECDVCGFTYKLNDLKRVVEDRRYTGILACDTCWDEDHPQNFVGEVDVTDPESLEEPRSDRGSRSSFRDLDVPGDITVEQYILNQTGGS